MGMFEINSIPIAKGTLSGKYSQVRILCCTDGCNLRGPTHCSLIVCLLNCRSILISFPTQKGRGCCQRWVGGRWLLGHLSAVALLFLTPSRNEVSHNGKLICNQFLALEFSGLDYFCLAATAQLISQQMQKPYRHARRSSFWTLLLTEVPKLHFQLWLWVSLSLGMTHPSLSIVFFTIIFIGPISSPGIEVILASGIGRLSSYLTSFQWVFGGG